MKNCPIKVVNVGDGHGWVLLHPASANPHAPNGRSFFEQRLRLRRFAQEARDELLATDMDWSKPMEEWTEEDRQKTIEVYLKWADRARSMQLDEETGELYRASPTTRELSTPDGSFKSFGAPSPEKAAEYRARQAAAKAA